MFFTDLNKSMKWLSVLLFILIQQCTVGLSSNKSKCPTISIQNGKVQIRRGKIIKFDCLNKFTLVGNKYSTCVRGEWDTPAPVCINAGCPIPPTPEHALVANRYDNGILIYFCEPNYELVGAPEIYCNGKQWNDTTPYCRDTTAMAPLKCDFEKTDLCWWEQDPKHDFDWQRHNFETPSSRIGTGPTHDHTLGAGNSGYYLYVEASGRLENDTARIISPLYYSNLTTNGCFSLWYHMYGSTVGSLRVYFRPEISSENPRLMFEKHGNQGNNWYQGIFNLPPSNVSFQIIIEGVRGSSYVSDMAVDDVAILQGDECRDAEKKISATTVQSITEQDDQVEIVNAMQSCYGRCGDSQKINTWTSMSPMTSPDICQCTIDCADNSTCCPDFSEYCVLGFSDGSSVDTSTIINSEPLPPEPKDGIDPNVTQPPVKSTSEKPTSTTTQKSTTKLVLTTPTTTTTSTKRPPKTITSTTKGQIQTVSPIVIATTIKYHDQTQTESNLIVEKIQYNNKKSSMTIIIFIVVPIATMIIAVISIFIITQRKKIYKKNSSKINSSALPEDSDVRFLTSDEVLDFNLARMPEDYNEL